MAATPLIGLTACAKPHADGPKHWTGDKYVAAVADLVSGAPLLIPALGDRLDLETLVDRLDGLVLTGSLSNVGTEHYSDPPLAPLGPQDPARDATTLPLITLALARGLPLLAICRGHQELNVALGGTLHQALQDLPGRLDHRAPSDGRPLAERYGPAHPVRLTPGGLLATAYGAEEAMVNSLHWQGIDRLAPGLAVEAVAPDGVIEAVRVADAPAFALSVQWHPEFQPRDHALSLAIFALFQSAAADHAARRSPRSAAPR